MVVVAAAGADVADASSISLVLMEENCSLLYMHKPHVANTKRANENENKGEHCFGREIIEVTHENENGENCCCSGRKNERVADEDE